MSEKASSSSSALAIPAPAPAPVASASAAGPSFVFGSASASEPAFSFESAPAAAAAAVSAYDPANDPDSFENMWTRSLPFRLKTLSFVEKVHLMHKDEQYIQGYLAARGVPPAIAADSTTTTAQVEAAAASTISTTPVEAAAPPSSSSEPKKRRVKPGRNQRAINRARALARLSLSNEQENDDRIALLRDENKHLPPGDPKIEENLTEIACRNIVKKGIYTPALMRDIMEDLIKGRPLPGSDGSA